MLVLLIMTNHDVQPKDSLAERVRSGELRWLTNAVNFEDDNLLGIEEERYVNGLRSRLGEDSVVVSTPMGVEDGKPTDTPAPIEGMVGVYVDAQRWEETSSE